MRYFLTLLLLAITAGAQAAQGAQDAPPAYHTKSVADAKASPKPDFYLFKRDNCKFCDILDGHLRSPAAQPYLDKFDVVVWKNVQLSDPWMVHYGVHGYPSIRVMVNGECKGGCDGVPNDGIHNRFSLAMTLQFLDIAYKRATGQPVQRINTFDKTYLANTPTLAEGVPPGSQTTGEGPQHSVVGQRMICDEKTGLCRPASPFIGNQRSPSLSRRLLPEPRGIFREFQ